VIWDLGHALVELGHEVTYLVAAGSSCPLAKVLEIDPALDLRRQIPVDIDIVHFQFNPAFDLDADFDKPYVVTEHGNTAGDKRLPLNSIFVSSNHAQRHGSDQFVYNGLNWDAYGPVDFELPRRHHHFLGKVAWRVKNVAGAIDAALKAGVRLAVLGGTRLNLKRGFRFTWSPKVEFYSMVGGQQKFQLLNAYDGLIFPVLWHEPFGLAVIESLYLGCPVFSTPYGSLPELVGPQHGVLSSRKSELVDAISRQFFDLLACHQHAVENFNATKMARGYIEKYQRVLDGERLSTTHPHACARDVRLPWV
jgi:glycosyltransferase involved in cell wall biosynthesis